MGKILYISKDQGHWKSGRYFWTLDQNSDWQLSLHYTSKQKQNKHNGTNVTIVFFVFFFYLSSSNMVISPDTITASL